MSERGTVEERFSRFASDVEPRLKQVLVSWHGVDVGAEVTADALAYAWERWPELEPMTNPVGSLFRVAQSRSRRYRRRPSCSCTPTDGPTRTRHAALGCGVSTVRNHLDRGMRRLRDLMGDGDA